ncbi:MAG: hypothetical protein RIS92_538 [Verrucomicrobiota bacterium]
MEELKGSLAIDGVWAVEVFDGGSVADAELVVETAHFGELVVDPFIESDAVAMSAFYHEWAWGDEGCHFGVVGMTGEVPFPNFVFSDENVAHWHGVGCALANPFVEVSATDAEAIVGKNGGGSHGALSAVAQAVERDSVCVDVGLASEPFEDALVLGVDDGVKGESERVETALKRSENVFAAVEVVGREGDEAALGEAEGEGLVCAPRVAGFIGFKEVFGKAFQTVLANHDWTLFAARNVFGNAEPSPRGHVFPCVDFDLVKCDGLGFSNQTGTRLERKQGGVEASDGIFPKGVASLFEGGLESFQVV